MAGSDPADAFHVIAPSIPGFGFSGPTREAGWDLARVARAWAELMSRLGYERYGAQGGDTGSVVSPMLGGIDSEHVVGVHVNGSLGFATGDPAELAGLSEAEQGRLAGMQRQMEDGAGYAIIQSTRPQTLGFGLADSPAGQLAWIVEKFKEWTDPAFELPEDAVDRDPMLTKCQRVLAHGYCHFVGAALLGGARQLGAEGETVRSAFRGGGVPRRLRGPCHR
ncbi:alpha/beta fold hydrolase [Arthrobacter sp. Y81]|uniref:alpha/beta fold hydrolase n=1 Tax=Arthrobacter sp. Y81 TaxID=2058897 RepID=UPI001CA57DAA|nr:hypothetical protein [Arthrobacter sp. Y81]